MKYKEENDLNSNGISAQVHSWEGYVDGESEEEYKGFVFIKCLVNH